MLILFDQGAPVGIRHALPDHVVKTAAQQGWSTLLNGELLRAAEEAGFDVYPYNRHKSPVPAERQGPEAGGDRP